MKKILAILLVLSLMFESGVAFAAKDEGGLHSTNLISIDEFGRVIDCVNTPDLPSGTNIYISGTGKIKCDTGEYVPKNNGYRYFVLNIFDENIYSGFSQYDVTIQVFFVQRNYAQTYTESALGKYVCSFNSHSNTGVGTKYVTKYFNTNS